MRKYLWIIPLALVVGACSIEEPSNSGGSILYPAEVSATIDESYADPDVRAYVDADLKILWENDDRISLFNQYTFNKEYRFSGRTGANSGVFKEVTSGDVVVGNELDNVYAVYPYMELTEISNSGVITLDLPAEQTYKANSFGRGDNTMISATTNTELMFKNLCGYLVLKLYGNGVSVSSISLKGNKGEPLAGTVDVTATVDSTPTLSFRSSGTYDTITLNCNPPVELGATEDDATVFWIVVPPTKFTGGFTLTVTDPDGKKFEKVSATSKEIVRNSTYRVKALEVDMAFSPEAVDLGLSVKWANYNLGTQDNITSGISYAWGETEGKNSYFYDSYKLCYWDSASSSYLFSKYNSEDKKTTLDQEDDAAHVIWGHQWRIPTATEFQELKTYCTWTWTHMNVQNSSFWGYKVTSKKEGFKDKWIFLPGNGYVNCNQFMSDQPNGYYWTSSLKSNGLSYLSASILKFDSTSITITELDRVFGAYIRPVCE